jgi:predicted nucleotidyltransferase
VRRRELERVGYFGSYAGGDCGVGSDLDVVIIVSTAPVPFHERPAQWDMLRLPVPVDLLVYTVADWTSVTAQPTHLAKALAKETHWVWRRAQPKQPV